MAKMFENALLLVMVAVVGLPTVPSKPCGPCKGAAGGEIRTVFVQYEDVAKAFINVKCMSQQILNCLSDGSSKGKDDRLYKVGCDPCHPELVEDYASNICLSPEKTGKVTPFGWPQVKIDVAYECEDKTRIKKCKPAGFAEWIDAGKTAASKPFFFQCQSEDRPHVTSVFVSNTCLGDPTSVPVEVVGSKTNEVVKVTFKCNDASPHEIKTCQPDRITLKSPFKAGDKCTQFSVGGSKYYIECKKFDKPCIGTKKEDCE